MNKSGPVVIIEDDADDREMLQEIFKSLPYKNEILFFEDGTTALDYLNSTQAAPFIIISDINMPRMNGFEVRSKIQDNAALHSKCIPYLFFTTAASQKIVNEAYAMAVQGFFTKPGSYTDLKNTIIKIMEYWIVCVAPTEYEHAKQAIRV